LHRCPDRERSPRSRVKPQATADPSNMRNRVFSAIHVVERLPRYQPWFAEAAKQTGIDWRLLAAIGYQESKWNPSASSEDGALGLMMLTPDTAAAMGIQDRADPREKHTCRSSLLCCRARNDSRQDSGAGQKHVSRWPPITSDSASRRRAYHRANAQLERRLLGRRA